MFQCELLSCTLTYSFKLYWSTTGGRGWWGRGLEAVASEVEELEVGERAWEGVWDGPNGGVRLQDEDSKLA